MSKKLNSLPKKEIISGKKEFERIFSNGIRFISGKLTVFACSGNGRKIGFSVSKKAGKSVKRNKIKRWMREAYRTNKNTIREDIELIMFVREWDDTLDYFSIKNYLIKIINEINKYDKSFNKNNSNFSC